MGFSVRDVKVEEEERDGCGRPSIREERAKEKQVQERGTVKEGGREGRGRR